MKNVKIYRADDYYKNMGTVIGFFTSKEEAEKNTEFTNPTNVGDGNFSQITEFEIPESKIKTIDISNTRRMLEEDIWGSGIILKDYYYI